MVEDAGQPKLNYSADGSVKVVGAWTAQALATTRVQPLEIGSQKDSDLKFDFSGLTAMDTFGAAAIAEQIENVELGGKKIELVGIAPRQATLIGKMLRAQEKPDPISTSQNGFSIAGFGRLVVEAGRDGGEILTVQGHIIVSVFQMLLGRGPVRLAAVFNQFLEITLRAIPIVALISLVVGIILTQQSISQLENFGAAIFVVDLSGILMLREVGILLAAIMVAGRSGSAIAAEIGAMRMREEIDALDVMGLDTYRAIVMPRVIALVVGMPLLGLIGAMAGIVGAALAARITGEISVGTFITRLSDVVDLHIISVGMIKAPIMAFAIAVIAVNEGLSVSGSTQSLGRHTTASVVKSIFMVILIDGVFAVFFEAIGF